MDRSTERWPGRLALMVAHCAGMVDLIALPVWVGTLVAHYGLDPQQAGGLATLFLVGALASSLCFAPRFHRLSGRLAASLGYGVAALAFCAAAQVQHLAALAALHALAGVAAGCGLSVTHGTIGRSARPHRLFAIVGTALGVFAIAFLGATPPLVATHGGATLFWLFGGVMAAAALAAAAAFPETGRHGADTTTGRAATAAPIGAAVWFGIAGLSAMSLVQAMTFSFLERVGMARGFGADAITGVLIALGFVNLVPAALAAALEQRCPARRVLLGGPLLHAALAMMVMHSAHFVPYAIGAMFIAGTMIFTHTFAFGLLARLDPSGRTTAATPAMLMVGSAIGPVLGGTLVKAIGYEAIGLAGGAFALLAVACFHRLQAPGAPRAVAARQLAKAGLHETDVHTVLFTHLHDDHTAGLAGLMTFAWTTRNPRLELIGPPGTRQLLDGALAFLSVNAAIRRQENPRLPPLASVFTARELSPGEVLDENDVRITALENTHYHFKPAADGPPHKSYALKVQTRDRTIVFTGDTGYADALVDFAKGADLLISEMASQQDIDSVPDFVRRHMLEEHMTAAQVGQLAARAGVRQLVLSHIRQVSDADLQAVKRQYGGPVTAGTDLARF